MRFYRGDKTLEEIRIAELFEHGICYSTIMKLIEKGCYNLASLSEYSYEKLKKVLNYNVTEMYKMMKVLRYYNIKLEHKEDESEKTIISLGRDYYFINLNDKSARIVTSYAQGYFSLLEAIFGDRVHITYSAVLNHPDTYLVEPLDEMMGTLSYKEQEIIKKRCGLYHGKPKSLEDVGYSCGMCKESVRQIEKKALRELRHPSRVRMLNELFYDKKDNVENERQDKVYGRAFEEIIKSEIAIIQKDGNKKNDDILFDRILSSPRFNDIATAYFETSIEELELSSKTCECLKSGGIKTLKALMDTDLDAIEKVEGLGSENFSEVLDFRMDLWKDESYDWHYDVAAEIKPIKLDAESIFCIENEVPITRTNLSPKAMLGLLQDGFFYVSDFLDNYRIFAPKSRRGLSRRMMVDDIEILHELKKYSVPMLMVKIPKSVQSVMWKKGINTFEELELEYDSFPKHIKERAYDLIQLISNAYSECRKKEEA